MAVFKPGVSTTIEALAPDRLLEVAVDRTNPLKVGKHVFQLVVTDDAGNVSDPAKVTIIIVDKDRPTAVIDVLDAQGVRNPAPEVSVPFGQKFALSADRSTDIGGEVKAFSWTLLQA